MAWLWAMSVVLPFCFGSVRYIGQMAWEARQPQAVALSWIQVAVGG